MKYIKSFVDRFKKDDDRELPSEKLYSRLSESTLDIDGERFTEDKKEKFSKYEIKELKNFISKNLTYRDFFWRACNYESISDELIIDLYHDEQIIIFKFSDDWFVTSYRSRTKSGSLEFSSDKCDTMDGVKQSLLNFREIQK